MDSCFICVLISRLSPRPPVPVTRAQLVVPSSFPPGWLWGSKRWSPWGSERPCCGGAEWQEWRRKTKTHKRSISELELEALAHCTVPRKPQQPEIDVLCLMKGLRMETAGARLPLTRGTAASNDGRGCVVPVLQCVSHTLPRNPAVVTAKELGRMCSWEARPGRGAAASHPGVKSGQLCLDAEPLSLDAAGSVSEL